MFRAFPRTRLLEQLRAMRHLPPSTELPQPASREQRQLLTDLLRLPEEVDPLQWLQAERGPVIVHIALQQELRSIKLRALGARRARSVGVVVPADELAFLGDLPNLPEDAAPFAALDQNAETSPETMHRVLEQLRDARTGSSQTRETVVAGRPNQRFAADLLNLSNDIDPLRWVQDERGVYAAAATLWHVLEACRPARTLLVGSVREVKHPMDVLESSGLVHAVIAEIVFAEGGFSIEAHIHVSTDALPRPSDVEHLTATWEGFDRVVDDRGYSYLRQHSEPRTVGNGGGTDETLRMAFYPAVAPNATMLTFSSTPGTLEVIGVNSANEPVSLPDVTLGELVWRVGVPPNVAGIG